jgi:DHA1 family tetracycline resistance protein-like MFS transporter
MFVLYTNYKLGWGVFDASIALGLIGFLGIFWQSIGIRYIIRKFDNVIPILFATLFVYPIASVLYGCVTSSAEMYALVVVGSIGGLSSSIYTAKISVIAAENGLAGTSLGMVGSLQNFIEVFMAVGLGHLLAWSMEHYQPHEFGVGIPYVINAFVYLSVVLMTYISHKHFGANRQVWMTHYDPRVDKIVI